jgi:hypothetical protein
MHIVFYIAPDSLIETVTVNSISATEDVSLSIHRNKLAIDTEILFKPIPDALGVFTIFMDDAGVITYEEWGDNAQSASCIGLKIQDGTQNGLVLFVPSPDIIKKYDAKHVSNIKAFILETFPGISKKYKLDQYKQRHLHPEIDIYSASTVAEVQVDLLTQILSEIIASDTALKSKYGDTLKAILEVSSNTVKPFDVNTLVLDKTNIRLVQKKYLDYKSTL